MAATLLLAAACGPDKSGATGTPATTPTSTKPAGNGIEAKSVHEILRAAAASFAKATSVHLKGTMVDSGETIGLNLSLGAAGAKGTVRAPMAKGKKPVSISILATKRNIYLKGREMWRSAGGAQAAALIGDRWVVIPKSNAEFKEFEQMTDLKKFANGLLKEDGPVTKGKPTVIHGVPAIGLRDSESTLYIATTGAPYPLEIVPKKPAKPGEGLSFLDYNAPLDVTPPVDPLDLNTLGH